MEAAIISKLDLICAKMERIDINEQKIDSVESALHDLRKENSVLREEIVAKDKVISSLSEQLNKVDQAARSASVRIIGLPINSDTTQQEVAKIVFDAIIHPIFLAAKTAGELPNVTFAPHFLINNVFSIPAKKGQACPVILTSSSCYPPSFSAACYSNTRKLRFRLSMTLCLKGIAPSTSSSRTCLRPTSTTCGPSPRTTG